MNPVSVELSGFAIPREFASSAPKLETKKSLLVVRAL